MSRRQLARHCKAGTFDAIKLPAANNIEEWFVAPASIEKGVADIQVLQQQRLRHDAPRRDMSSPEPPEMTSTPSLDAPGHDATRLDTTGVQHPDGMTPLRQDTSRHDAPPDLAIYEHPYVRRLEAQVDKWEGKYLEQVRRTEDIQRDQRKELIELQRMTAVGNNTSILWR
jgi:hypothetical protein